MNKLLLAYIIWVYVSIAVLLRAYLIYDDDEEPVSEFGAGFVAVFWPVILPLIAPFAFYTLKE